MAHSFTIKAIDKYYKNKVRKMKKRVSRFHNSNIQMHKHMTSMKKKYTSLLNHISEDKEKLLEENEALCIENDKLKKRRQKSIVVREKESNIKVYIGIAMCWTKLYLLCESDILDTQSFTIVNVCILITILIITLFTY